MQLDDLKFNPVPHRYPQGQLYAFSGRGSVGIIPDTVMGIGSFYFPPVSGKHFRFFHTLVLPELRSVLGDSAGGTHYTPHRLMLQEIEWAPWRIRRIGIFNHYIGKRLVTIKVCHELFAPADGDGIIAVITLTLCTPGALRVEFHPRMENADRAFGVCPASAWNYEIPAAEASVWSEGSHIWRTDGCTMRVRDEQGAVTLHAGEPCTTWHTLTLEGPGLTPVGQNPARHAARAEAYWRERWLTMRRTTGPAMDALPDSRRRLFARAWLTTVTCRWMRENFIARPYYAAEGIDGGSICSYLWDFSYTSSFLTALEGRSLAGLIRHMLDEKGIFEGYSLDPIEGQWLGVMYAFSPYALTKIVADYAEGVKDAAFLRQAVPVLERILLAFDRRWRHSSGLLDFGDNRHLIELHTAGYQGLVPNPNFEHAWCFQALNRLRIAAGLRRSPAYERRAAHILRQCDRYFWNNKAGWYFPAAQRGAAGIWSIQVLSALRLGVFPPAKVRRMAAHLRDGRFLGRYGLYSIARDDALHFTLNDTDWGGDGCFCGHTGIVLEGLARYGLRDQMETVLDRIQWWADAMPYIPQETRADAPQQDRGRANLIAAGAVCQALLLPVTMTCGRDTVHGSR